MRNLAKYVVRNTPRSVKNVIGKPLRRLAGGLASADNLEQLGLKHATDKFTSGFLRRYQQHFNRHRLSAKAVLEIGIGGYQHVDQGGESLRLWADYFSNAAIHGVDIYDKSAHDTDRITTHIGGQDNVAFLDTLIQRTGRPDIIIDDGSHISAHIIFSFEHLFPRLKPGGVYVIEDIGRSYDAEYGGDPENIDRRDIATGYLKTLIDTVNCHLNPNRVATAFDHQIAGLSIYPGICFIEKTH